jgi:phosphoribosyl 1,2-cyclic phosphodiesterase
MKKVAKKENFIKFLGTAGARFVMIKQLRASGGIWINVSGTNVLVDPGPGSIVRCANARPRLDPAALEAIILTHRHLDHCGDINVMIEGMTEGGFKKRGTVFCPRDAIESDTVILQHTRDFVRRLEVIGPGNDYSAGAFKFRTSMRHLHPVETYGLKFKVKKTSISILADTSYFEELADFYNTDIVIVFVAFLKPRAGVDHLCLDDVQRFLERTRPKKAILSHFGMTMLAAKPHLQAEELSRRIGREVIAAYDGMSLDL